MTQTHVELHDNTRSDRLRAVHLCSDIHIKCEQALTFSDLSGVTHLSTQGHADIHVVGGGV